MLFNISFGPPFTRRGEDSRAMGIHVYAAQWVHVGLRDRYVATRTKAVERGGLRVEHPMLVVTPYFRISRWIHKLEVHEIPDPCILRVRVRDN